MFFLEQKGRRRLIGPAYPTWTRSPDGVAPGRPKRGRGTVAQATGRPAQLGRAHRRARPVAQVASNNGADDPTPGRPQPIKSAHAVRRRHIYEATPELSSKQLSPFLRIYEPSALCKMNIVNIYICIQVLSTFSSSLEQSTVWENRAPADGGGTPATVKTWGYSSLAHALDRA